MLDLNKYKSWLENKKSIKYPKVILESHKISKSDINILSNIGMPVKQEPSLWFLTIEEGGLKKLNQVYSLNYEDYIEYEGCEEYNEEFMQIKAKEFEKYIVIGKSLGDAICINEKNEIVSIDCYDFTEYFVNKSLEQFLEFMLSYDTMINNIKLREGSNIDYYDYVEEEDIKKLNEKFRIIANDYSDNYDFWDLKLSILEDDLD